MIQSNKEKAQLAAFAAIAVLSGGVIAPPSNAQTYSSSQRTGDQVALEPGTVIPVKLNDELSSNNSSEGDTFTARVDTSREAYNSILNGATVQGEVTQATQKNGNNPGTLQVKFTRINLPDGTTYPIDGKPTSLDSKNLKVNSDGTFQVKNYNKNQSLTYAGIGAGAGALLSILGNHGQIKIEDLLLGGGLGYGAGELLKNKQVHDVDLQPGTSMGVLLGDRVYFHRRRPVDVVTPGTYTHGGTYSAPLKYYTYNGERWSYNPSTGERRRVQEETTQTVITTTTTTSNNRRYYSYQGHPYYLDLTTGARVRLD
jgi:hypothetical protein